MQTNNPTLPNKMIGIIGGGQLGRMMSIAAKYMGYNVIVLDPTPNCPTSQVADEQIVAAYNDMEAIKELTDKSDVVTYEFENVDLAAAAYIEKAGKLPQGAYALEVTQNREKEKRVMQEVGLPIPSFSIVESGAACEAALQDTKLPAVIKTCRGGYDGKGQMKIETEADFPDAIEFAEQGGTFIIEEWITFDKEISVIFTRATTGEIEIFPIAENDHKDHILYETIAPARISETVREKAMNAATLLAKQIDIVGTFAIEMFVQGEEVFINEMAPRPHNSGHYTIEACNVSQFTNHIRAICNLPLTKIRKIQDATMINILGEDMNKALHALANQPDAFVHLYGKAEPKEKRKMGHVTFIGDNEADTTLMKQVYEEER
ncbi:MAG TPA: 5-(carboxyamino)imidazole ribonucleotide synthase [Pseudogracilibacillus sp.]|nr:5-(carboxyamino)imidazole ribonucleotide synthase [Pseudogracilibacillus sp.]